MDSGIRPLSQNFLGNSAAQEEIKLSHRKFKRRLITGGRNSEQQMKRRSEAEYHFQKAADLYSKRPVNYLIPTGPLLPRKIVIKPTKPNAATRTPATHQAT
jgi:hypothetical protein